MTADLIAKISSLVVAFIFAWAIRRGLAAYLQATFDELLHLPAFTKFYVRAFSLGLYFIALGSALFEGYDAKTPPAHFMEYVWPVARTLLNLLVPLGFYLLFHILLVTIAAWVVRRRNVE